MAITASVPRCHGDRRDHHGGATLNEGCSTATWSPIAIEELTAATLSPCRRLAGSVRPPGSPRRSQRLVGSRLTWLCRAE